MVVSVLETLSRVNKFEFSVWMAKTDHSENAGYSVDWESDTKTSVWTKTISFVFECRWGLNFTDVINWNSPAHVYRVGVAVCLNIQLTCPLASPECQSAFLRSFPGPVLELTSCERRKKNAKIRWQLNLPSQSLIATELSIKLNHWWFRIYQSNKNLGQISNILLSNRHL